MVVPKTTALPLGYAPKIISYNTKFTHYIAFDNLHQYLGNFFCILYRAFLADFRSLKYPTQTEPDPDILENSQLICDFKNRAKILIFGYILKAAFSKSLVSFFNFFKLNNVLKLYKKRLLYFFEYFLFFFLALHSEYFGLL